MTDERADQVGRVCAAWGRGPAVAIEPLATVGFSGAAVHAVTLADAAGRFVLKPFAPHVARERAAWVHDLMRHARAAGVTEVPEVLRAADGGTVVADGAGRCWELVRFVDGRPFTAPGPARAAAAVAAIARLHAAARSLPQAAPDRGPAPGVEQRRRQAGDLLERPWSTRSESPAPACGDADVAGQVRGMRAEAGRLLATPLGRRGLLAVAEARLGDLPRQAVVRDIWSDHVLFASVHSDRVAGLVDFHAAGIDTPLTDLARLLGSWTPAAGTGPAPGLTAAWPEAVAAYDRVRGTSLTAAERWLCDWLHASGVVCSLDNWFRWVLTENRRFADPNRALERIRSLTAALSPAIWWLAEAGNRPV